MALLGALSLSGMLIKNGIVLIDVINSQLTSGKAPWNAVVDASLSRVRPVSMAVLTTVFGLIPLLFDVFFGAMAVTIVVGLLFTSALTLMVVPVPLCHLFPGPSRKRTASAVCRTGSSIARVGQASFSALLVAGGD